MLDAEAKKKLLPLKSLIVNCFNSGNWTEIGVITGCLKIVENHPRLLRSLYFGDEDYDSCVLTVLLSMVDEDVANLDLIKKYVEEKCVEGENVSSVSVVDRKIWFCPSVFSVPVQVINPNLISVMMPFERSFNAVYDAIKSAACSVSFECVRVDDIWQNSVVVQDVFDLIFKSYVVVCDFTGKNPNVFYETGIAHTLGKHVIPITQHAEDVPFDLRHHRFLRYLNNSEGLGGLSDGLKGRLSYLDQNRG